MKAMLATQSDAAGFLWLTLDVGLHYYLPPVETPPSRAPWLYLARDTETPFTPPVSLSINARDTSQMEMSVQRSPSAAACANASVAVTCYPTAHAVGCTAWLADVPT